MTHSCPKFGVHFLQKTSHRQWNVIFRVAVKIPSLGSNKRSRKKKTKNMEMPTRSMDVFVYGDIECVSCLFVSVYFKLLKSIEKNNRNKI